MAQQRSFSSFNHPEEVAMDDDSDDEFEPESDSDGDDFQRYSAEESSETDSEEADFVQVGFVDYQPQPSTSRSVNTRGGNRRGRGQRNRGRISARQQERLGNDRLWTEEDIKQSPPTPPFTGELSFQTQTFQTFVLSTLYFM